MSKLAPLLFLLLTDLVWSQSLRDLSGSGQLPAIDRLTFTATARWDPELLAWVKHKPDYLPRNWKQVIVLPAPPDNSSVRTRAELANLKEKIKDRPGRTAAIKNELELKNFKFGQLTYGDLTSRKDLAHTGELVRSMYHSVSCAVFVMKHHFNRPRPTVVAARLGIDLEASIPNPGHPAYPSGHATGAYAIAYLLRELDPAHADDYPGDAARIAENREIAGVHYPSDSEAGRLLARQLIDAFLRNRSFRAKLDKARREWPVSSRPK